MGMGHLVGEMGVHMQGVVGASIVGVHAWGAMSCFGRVTVCLGIMGMGCRGWIGLSSRQGAGLGLAKGDGGLRRSEIAHVGDGTDQPVSLNHPIEPPQFMYCHDRCGVSCGQWWVTSYLILALLEPLSFPIQLLLLICFWFSHLILIYSPHLFFSSPYCQLPTVLLFDHCVRDCSCGGQIWLCLGSHW